MGLVNRLSEPGAALADAVALAHELARFPQRCLRGDRLSAYGQWDRPYVGRHARRGRPRPRHHPLERDARRRGPVRGRPRPARPLRRPRLTPG